MTKKIEFELASAGDIRRGLMALGVDWNPRPDFSADKPGLLYTWGLGDAPDDFAVCYIGKDARAGKRIKDETAWSTADYYHAHALAVQRIGMTVVAAPTESLPGPERAERRAALRSYVINHRHGDRSVLEHAMSLIDSEDLPRLESFAIRFSVHMGTVGAPINASAKNAWEITSPNLSALNNLAYWVADGLKQNALHLSGEVTDSPE